MKKLKRILIFAAMVATLACLLCVAVNAETYSGTCGDNLTWSLDTATGVLKINGTGAMTEYSSSADRPWYDYRTSIKTIEIADGVTSIGQNAFNGCSSLVSITFGENSKLTSIGKYAFALCKSLASIEIPSGVTSIGASAFGNCIALTSIEIPAGVTSIGMWAFSTCTGLTSFTFGENSKLTSIGNKAFYNCNKLTSIEIPAGVTSIGESAFESCNKLASIEIPSGVASIENGTFYRCSSLTSITIYSNLVSIYAHSTTLPTSATIYGGEGSTAQEYAKEYGHTFVVIAVPTVEIASGTCGENLTWTFNSDWLLKISGTGDMAEYKSSDRPWYNYLSRIKTIEIASGVTSIGKIAFSDCTGLTSVTIGDNSQLTSIGYNAFSNCTGLTSVTFGANSRLTSIGSKAFYNCTKLTSIEIPASVTSIGTGAFQNCTKLTSIRIPSGVKSIEESVFDYCENLQNVQLQYGVTIIGAKAFYNCTKLTSIIIPASVTSIGSNAFRFCGLTSIKIYSKTAEIYDSEYTIPGAATIYGYKGSTAQAYATKYSRSFVETACNIHSTDGTYKHDATNHWQECSVCGEKAVEEIHTYENGVCTACGYKQYALTDAQVSIGSDISIKFYARGITEENANQFALKVTRNGAETTLVPQSFTDGSYYFRYEGITPQCMGDEFSAELYMGETKVDTLESYSVKQYLNTIISGDYAESSKQLAKDMLAYGAAAQVYRNYNAESLVTTDPIRTVTLPTDGKVLVNATEADAPIFTSASLWFDNVNKLRIYFTASSLEGLTVTIGGVPVDAANIKDCGDGKYMVETDGIYASVFGTQFEIKLLVDGAEKSTLKYSVYDYIAGAQSLSDAKWQNLVKALYAYGESANAYVTSN